MPTHCSRFFVCLDVAVHGIVSGGNIVGAALAGTEGCDPGAEKKTCEA